MNSNRASQQLREDPNNNSNPGKEIYCSYFSRKVPETTDISPSHSSNANPNSLSKNQQTKIRATRFRNGGKLSSRKQKVNSEDEIKKLQKQNAELKSQIAELRVSQFYHFDDQKLRNLLMQVQKLKEQLQAANEEIEKLRIQNDFLSRTNYHLKLEIQQVSSKEPKNIIVNEKRQNYPENGPLTSRPASYNTFKEEYRQTSELNYQKKSPFKHLHSPIKHMQSARTISVLPDYILSSYPQPAAGKIQPEFLRFSHQVQKKERRLKTQLKDQEAV